MKPTVLSSFMILAGVLFESGELAGQCTADAGPDIVVCSDVNGVIPAQIGGDPTASGGTPPYTYTWETYKYVTIGGTTYTYGASCFLNDTTLANPTIIWGNFDSLDFRVTVHDVNGISCLDSVLVRFSFFAFTLEDKRRTIHQGDSVQLYSSVMLGIPPLTYHWEPDYNLSDPDVPFPWARPDTSVAYTNTVTDSAGCQAVDGDAFEVYVIPVGSVDHKNSTPLISIQPNPMKGQSVVQLNCDPRETELQFIDIHGRVERTIRPESRRFTLSGSELSKGIYFYRLTRKDVQIAVGKLIIE